MTQSAAVVFILLILGDVTAESLNLPIPGAALGLAVLAGAFAIRGAPPSGFQELFDFAAPYFPMLFVPAAVGVIASMDILASAWVHVATAIILGTALTILVTGLVSQALLNLIAEVKEPAT